ncbi:hypothetical protein QJS10_CPA06g00500 [Acorus calamus]|uniref:Uncharacterized protein n=1 Tax=Acorus calamus TaxID=4465 RepID=A0AAV9ELH0_ACOCL|nr:hypothetical protein QJS10_CPA06g00500 [Acorus calamus]
MPTALARNKADLEIRDWLLQRCDNYNGNRCIGGLAGCTGVLINEMSFSKLGRWISCRTSSLFGKAQDQAPL